MRTYDLSPLFRSTVGFDRLSRLLEGAMSGDEAASYPPYNIEKLGEDAYRITMAVAGFGQEDLDITAHQNSLVVTGKARKEPDSANSSTGVSPAAHSSAASSLPTSSGCRVPR
eukprot:TRINITY_DN86120_c0_g1_i1.p2 TRINITY_DN86120_c0_g1~~TRINITY_DN86120_c0_g1_i1.p2  ORF type:complete len:113 (+),score=12.13 TRINITY_DN86120_c0_g1_i1:87-425(+)